MALKEQLVSGIIIGIATACMLMVLQFIFDKTVTASTTFSAIETKLEEIVNVNNTNSEATKKSASAIADAKAEVDEIKAEWSSYMQYSAEMFDELYEEVDSLSMIVDQFVEYVKYKENLSEEDMEVFMLQRSVTTDASNPDSAPSVDDDWIEPEYTAEEQMVQTMAPYEREQSSGVTPDTLIEHVENDKSTPPKPVVEEIQIEQMIQQIAPYQKMWK